MSKFAKSAKDSRKKTRQGLPLVVYMGGFGLGLIGYMVGEIGLHMQPHPVHWAAGLVGVVIGLLGGWLWYWRRGDIT